ncbi:unnamed protein product [Tuber melanosporum]|uniref:(Perigord truffle) hypothetical protein n=1 Tax=Tuber melanosporum (strain Mel28) TaxID=656061 RepID=D5G6U5_TUBMM|nr:uncharacterized protein GSTUM_00002274001 [Tuber melanosporum]CAZ80238.1 unnamed protein product [Tuber melanosporum]
MYNVAHHQLSIYRFCSSNVAGNGSHDRSSYLKFLSSLGKGRQWQACRNNILEYPHAPALLHFYLFGTIGIPALS